MSDDPGAVPVDPDDAPLEAVAVPKRSLAPLDPISQLVVGAGLAVAIIGLLGGLAGAWEFIFAAIILIVVGLVGAAAGWVSGGRAVNPLPIATRDLALAGGTISAALGVLYAVQIVMDFDDLDTRYAGVVGLVLTFALAVAGVALYLGATRSWTAGPAAPWTQAVAANSLPTTMVIAGAGLVLLGWLGNITIGAWYLGAAVEVITFALLAALIMRAGSDPEQPLDLGFPLAWIALALALLCTIIALQHTFAFIRQGLGIEDWVVQLVYVAGVVVLLIGAGLGALAPLSTPQPKGSDPV